MSLFFIIGTGAAASLVNLGSVGSIWTGVWHHIVGTYDGTTEKVYLDGAHVGTDLTVSAPIIYESSSNLFIGKGQQGTESYDFTGTIDDVRIYNYALSASQVKQIYNQGSAVRFGPQTGSP